MRRRPPQTKIQKLGDVLQNILKDRNILLTSEKQRLQAIWSKAVGAQIAAQTSPDRQKKGTLYVRVFSPVWMQQLHFLKGEIIDNINRHMEKDFIKNIFFSVGELPPASRMHQDLASFFPESFPLSERDKKVIEQSISSVSDQELKEILKRVMTKDMIRRRLSGNRKAP
jgi:hypothetical protein